MISNVCFLFFSQVCLSPDILANNSTNTKTNMDDPHTNSVNNTHHLQGILDLVVTPDLAEGCILAMDLRNRKGINY